jgi:hypothetical protein
MMKETYQSDVPGVAEEDPKLNKGQDTNPGNSEQTNPLDADSDAEAEASHDKPKPPAEGKGLLRAELVLVRERVEGEGGEGSGSYQRRIEEDKASLSQKTVLCTTTLAVITGIAMGLAWERTKNDEASAHECSHCTATESLECQEHEGNEKDTAESREQAHCNVWNTGLDVVLANLLEVEAAVEAGKPSRQGDEHLGQGRVNVHEELALDIFRSETTEAMQ